MTPWVKWTIAGFFAAITIGSLYTVASSDQSGEFGKSAKEAQTSLNAYDAEMCKLGHQKYCK